MPWPFLAKPFGYSARVRFAYEVLESLCAFGVSVELGAFFPSAFIDESLLGAFLSVRFAGVRL